MAHNFLLHENEFYLDGEPFKIISGAIHYFRVVPEYWRDRLEKLKAMGCNTVETYIPWNLHEPRHGEYCFEGLCDVERFVQTAAALDLLVILRPGPFICAEWEYGGLPAWLLAEDGLRDRLRTQEPRYMKYLESWWSVLLPRLVPYQMDRGGPVILMQVENEYGYYGDDSDYLEGVRELMRHSGITVPLVTSDGPMEDALNCGSLEGALATANFGSKAAEKMEVLRRHVMAHGGGPLMCMEFWVGWFDAWEDETHHTTGAEESARELDEILKRGSVNFYMFHGGTNFGFMNGANYYEKLRPDVTSYDYDAPLSEDGRPTEKYERFKQVIARYAEIPEVVLSTEIKRFAYGEKKVVGAVSFDRDHPDGGRYVDSPWPLSMEKLGQSYGYTLYSTLVDRVGTVESFRLMDAADRAIVFVNGERKLTLYDRALLEEHKVNWPVGPAMRLDILVENMGRVNFGHRMPYQRKGIDGAVLLNGRQHIGWRMRSLAMKPEYLERIDFAVGKTPGLPAIYSIPFTVEQVGDTFLDMAGWGKGCALLNGFNLGRFWKEGPQKRLYVPGPLLKRGDNRLLVFETEDEAADSVTFYDEPLLG